MLTASFAVTFFCFLVFAFMPAMGVLSYFHIKRGKPLRPKAQRYLISICFLLLLFYWALEAASQKEMVLFPRHWPEWIMWVFPAVFVPGILLRIWQGWEKIPAERKKRMRLLLPETRAHLPYWVFLSVLAGLAEETAYRGVAYVLVLDWTRSAPVTLLICVAAFGVAHATQGWRAVLGVALFGMIFHAIVLLTGSLYVAMVMHAAYDLGLGFVVVRKFETEAVAAESAAPATV